MSQKFFLLVAVSLGAAAFLAAQTPAPQLGVPANATTAAERAVLAPTDSDIYCAGFFTHRPIESELFVLGSEDGGLKYEFIDRNIIYLNRGRKTINAPGGQYMVVRPVKDIIQYESFPGQHKLLSQLGTLYAEIARIEVQILHEDSATAQVLHACEPILGGDIAIPLAARPAPPYKAVMFTDRFAPASGKTTGVIAAIKEFQAAAGTGEIVYLNIGKKQGAQVGSYLRVFHTFVNQNQDPALKSTRNYLTDLMGVSEGHRLTAEEMKTVPRAVLGEVLILSSEEESSTGIITYSLQGLQPGDQVEIE